MNEFGQIAKGHSWVHQHIEVAEHLNFAESMATLARRALLRISVGERLAEGAHRAFGVLKSFQLRWKLPDGSDVAIGIDPVPGYADSGVLDEDLAGLFVEVGHLARTRGVGILFAIDEIQYLAKRDLAALIVALHQISQERLPLMVVGAGLPSLPALAGEARSYAERLFSFCVIDNLDASLAAEALTTPADEEDVRWEPGALAVAVNATEGYPYFLQEFGKQAWDVAAGPSTISEAEAVAAMPIAMSELDAGFFRVRIDRTTDAERAYLAAMTSLGDGPYNSGDVAKAMEQDHPAGRPAS